MQLRPKTSATTPSSSTPSGVQTPSRLSVLKDFDDFFEKYQYPSNADMENLSIKTGVSLEHIRYYIANARSRVKISVAAGRRKELPWQMKRLREVVDSKKDIDDEVIEDLKEELGIEEYSLRNFFSRAQGISFSVCQKMWLETQFPSTATLKQLARKTGRSCDAIRMWFYTNRQRVLSEFEKGEIDELPCQMKAMYEKYMEKQYVTQKEMDELVKKFKIQPRAILTFFQWRRWAQRRAGKRVIEEKDVPKLKYKFREDEDLLCEESGEDSGDENEEEIDENAWPAGRDEQYEMDNDSERFRRSRSPSTENNRSFPGRRTMGLFDEDVEMVDEEAQLNRRIPRTVEDDWDMIDSLPPPARSPSNRNSRVSTPVHHQSSDSPISRGISPTSNVSRHEENQRTPSDDQMERMKMALANSRVRILGEEFRNVILPFNLSLDTKNWDEDETAEVAEQMFPSGAVNVIRKNQIDGGWCKIFILSKRNIFEALEHNEQGFFTYNMFLEFGENLKKIEELKKGNSESSSTEVKYATVEDVRLKLRL